MYSKTRESLPTPYYLFREDLFAENIKRLYDAFRALYPEYKVAYSFKTNYTPYICRLAKDAGCYAEVVSDMEYALARKLGYANAEIIYNGPFKGEMLEEHLLGGGIVNIDNPEECERICRLAGNNPTAQFKIGLRINLDLGAGFISRFGMEDGGEDLQRCLAAIDSCDNLKVTGLHCHIKAPRDPESWRRRAELMIAAADKYIKGVPEYLSLGSGMVPGLYKQFTGEEDAFCPDYADFAKELFVPIIERYPSGKRPVIFTEPGRALITRFISFFCKVDNIKTVRGRKMATTDGSFHNVGEMISLAHIPAKIHHQGEGQHYDAIDIMGYTCLEDDVIFPSYSGNLAVGDIVEFRNAGGYSIVYKPPFICPQCAMYSMREDGSLTKIMREETFDDVFGKFLLP